jgi:hypothetical protein
VSTNPDNVDPEMLKRLSYAKPEEMRHFTAEIMKDSSGRVVEVYAKDRNDALRLATMKCRDGEYVYQLFRGSKAQYSLQKAKLIYDFMNGFGLYDR